MVRNKSWVGLAHAYVPRRNYTTLKVLYLSKKRPKESVGTITPEHRAIASVLFYLNKRRGPKAAAFSINLQSSFRNLPSLPRVLHHPVLPDNGNLNLSRVL